MVYCHGCPEPGVFLSVLRRLVIVIGWLAVFSLLVGLAFWQFQRGQEKSRLLEAYGAAQAHSGALEVNADAARSVSASGVAFIKACFTGRYEQDRQFLLDGQIHDGIAGFDVWTPLKPADGDPVIVNRGWVAQDANRAPAGSLRVPENDREVCGMLVRFPRSGWSFRASVEPHGWPKVVVYPDPAELEQALGSRVYPLLLQLDSHEPDGFERNWRPVVMPPERHYGYAFQWASLALTWVVISVVFWRRHR